MDEWNYWHREYAYGELGCVYELQDGLGIAAQAVTLDLNTSAGGLSQLNTASVVQSTVTNGTAFGNLSEIKIDEGGFVTAIFDNGVTRRIAQVALATFPSPDSLTAALRAIVATAP